jgi:hypothetical protein
MAITDGCCATALCKGGREMKTQSARATNAPGKVFKSKREVLCLFIYTRLSRKKEYGKDGMNGTHG